MPKLKGLDYIPFPFEKLCPQPGTLTWLREFEDSPIEGFVLEFPIPPVVLFGDDEDEDYRAIDQTVTLTLEAKSPHLPWEALVGTEIVNADLKSSDFGGSIYLGWRHHGIELRRVNFRGCANGSLTADIDCRVCFTDEGLAAGEGLEFDDSEWRFSAPVVVQERIQSYRTRDTRPILRRMFDAVGRIFRL